MHSAGLKIDKVPYSVRKQARSRNGCCIYEIFRIMRRISCYHEIMWHVLYNKTNLTLCDQSIIEEYFYRFLNRIRVASIGKYVNWIEVKYLCGREMFSECRALKNFSGILLLLLLLFFFLFIIVIYLMLIFYDLCGFVDAKERVGCGKQREATAPIHPL